MELKQYVFHALSIDENMPDLRETTQNNSEVVQYIEKVLLDVTRPPKGQTEIRGQLYDFPSKNERVVANIYKMLDVQNKDIWFDCALDNAMKLLYVEKQVQLNIEQLGKDVRKGCLLQVSCCIDEQEIFVLLKIDDNTFLDKTLLLQDGLPLNTRMQKVAIVYFTTDHEIEKVLLSDTNARISTYWHTSFLEATARRDSSINTRRAFNEIEKSLKKHVKKISQQDYYFLRNILVLSLRKERFDFNDLIEQFTEYEPISAQLSTKHMEDVIKKLELLPSDAKNGFDTRFDINKQEITARLVKNKIVIDENFELIVTKPIEDLQNLISADIDENDRKFVKIYSDMGYLHFKRKP